MDFLTSAVRFALYAVMALSIVAAIGVVTLRNLFHAALALAFVLLGIAAVYLALHAEFIALVQILLYVGAVMTLVIFAIMLTERFGDKSIPQSNRLSLPALSGSIVFLVALSQLILHTPWPVREENLSARVGVFELGKAFMETYVFPFEVISVILIAVLVGAITVARKEKE